MSNWAYKIKKLFLKMKQKHMELKAQYTIYALFMTVLTLIAFVAVYPLLDELVVESGIEGIEGTLLTWSPLFIVLFILWSAMWYVNPRRE
jgi:hypothetical protein